MLSISGYSWTNNYKVYPRIIAANHVRMSTQNKVQYCIHPQWTLDYVYTESGLHRLGSKNQPWIPRKAGEAHLHAAGCPYWENLRRCPKPIIESAYIIFELGRSRLFKWDDTGSDTSDSSAPLQYMRFQDPSSRLGRLLKSLAALGQQRGDEAFWEAQAMLCQVIGLLLGSRAIGENEREILEAGVETCELGFVYRVDLFLQQHLEQTITLEDIARHLHVSPSTLSHRYRTETGQSPMVELTRKRINLAKLMLSKGHSLKTIAPATGFCDAFHLSKTFKRLEGISPSRYLSEQQAQTIRN